MMPPILVADLFPEITRHLLELLRSLSADEWRLPTVSSRRTVKDIASHLLDGSLRRLSMQRDGYRPADGWSVPRAGEPLMDFLNREIGNRVAIVVTGEAGGSWQIERRTDSWEQIVEPCEQPTATVTMDQDTTWKLVTKRRSREAVRQQFPGIQIQGDVALGCHVLDMVSVMA